MTYEQIYDLCLEAHVFKWIENYREMNPVVYLEMRGGPLISSFIQYYGLMQVVGDFEKKIKSES